MAKKKKNEKVFETPEQEISYLRKQVAGLKGANSSLTKDKEHFEKLSNGLSSQVSELAKKLKVLQKEFENAKGEKDEAMANLEYYKALPWYKRIFMR